MNLCPPQSSPLGRWLALGTAIGTALGVATNDLAVGVAFGTSLGLLAGALLDTTKAPREDGLLDELD